MFTGLISDVGTLLSVEPRGDLKRLRIASHYPHDSLAMGASVAHNGVCMTLVGFGPRAEGDSYVSWHEADAAAETLAVTTAGAWAPGEKINLERALRIGDELGGHLVSGHVDGVATIASRRDFDNMAHFEIEAPKALAKFIAEKGSVALDGTSLTVNKVEKTRFTILLIPHTLEVTNWGGRMAGDKINIEVDTMARYAARLAEAAGE
ncbi:riboflavin synthase [Rhodoblastus acidophilus]|uniref:Riboflavin synthase n=1 Tax=Candidatus Rhodoblastus alkanivorans TaxID=2954117 RepID=A0ABS9Z688_9HYPH|nr:riboflavin synthase [Candidatus Rhodoblastus alkanivorans]MCI4679145.1 riboflavin synthase [Candidatus Rhodoblastus alkanivorans]MCI4683141.1 riboflavin synthase [Candidatus Rhodoblastus alkanivorans]MDI4640452.1 riboflavin synthase [Rhodoblastus acidophilus]